MHDVVHIPSLAERFKHFWSDSGLNYNVTDLLGFIKAMYLIDEQNGISLAQTELILGLFDHLTHITG